MPPLKSLTVTEWTESRHWTESTETYEAKRSAQANYPSENPARRGSRGRGLKSGFRSGLAASQVAASLHWPIAIWYSEELTE